ncbi:TetR/AcrR family transcriptional regulator [Streptomyces sp. NPDC101225]|uniref:TetR/AcrR family transcriptional regulator n=1 Tax=Streptomyces sp. NPDC101225 TaxID=3366135 RepID=UPI003820874B
MTPTSVERGNETRARLLEAAAQLIVEVGWGAVTTRKVADRAGVRQGLVHYHFPTVTDLLIDAALDSARREVEGAMTALMDATDPALGMEQMLTMMATYSAGDPATVLYSEMLLASARHERLRVGLSRLMRTWRAAAGDWLRRNGADGDTDTAAVLLGAAIDGLVMYCIVDPTVADLPVAGPLLRLVGFSDSSSESDSSSKSDGAPERARARQGDGSPESAAGAPPDHVQESNAAFPPAGSGTATADDTGRDVR